MTSSTDRSLRRLGHSGLAVSTVGLGCNNLGRTGTATADLNGSRAVVQAALEAGVTLFDTADIYGAEPGVSETLLGQSLGRQRSEVVVATKFGLDARGVNGPDDGARGSRRYVFQAVEASLRRLGTDWIDLYQLHAPDPATPIGETLSALDDLVRAGKVRYIGHSQFAGWQAVDADWSARQSSTTRFLSTQAEYSLLHRDPEADLLPALEHLGVGLLPFFPLANGLLTGKYRREEAPAGSRLAQLKPELLASAPWDTVEALTAFASDRGIGLLDVAFGWLLDRPAVASVIAGATRPEQVRANVAAGAWVPNADDLQALDAITR